MDFGKKQKFGAEKSVESLNCQTSSLSNTDWHQISSSLCNWNQPTDTQSLSFSRATNTSSSDIGKPVPLNWNPSDSVEQGEVYFSMGSRMLPFSLSHFSSENGFIERAAKLSCFVSNTSNASAEAQMLMNGAGKITDLKDKSKLNDHSSNSGRSSMKDQSELESPIIKKRKRSNQEMELNKSQDTAQLPSDAAKNFADSKQKAEKSSPTMATVKPSGKNSKVTGEHKEDYIHVRARRGQATNSHSLAERVRREKINERMKFLQDLVPGCSKITGKSFMLDEIINYVQSLQRQVEFLSMKLAAVNPRLEFNIEGILSKDLFQTRCGSSSAIGFSRDMINHQLHSIHQDLIQVGMAGVMNPTGAYRRELNVQLPSTSGFKEASQQMPNAWDDDLQNIVHMTYGSNPPLKTQDLNGAPQDSFPL